jgi:hypothetical protein
MPGSVSGARFLKQHEKEYVLAALKQDGALSENDIDNKFSWKEVIKAFKSIQTLLMVDFHIYSKKLNFLTYDLGSTSVLHWNHNVWIRLVRLSSCLIHAIR